MNNVLLFAGTTEGRRIAKACMGQNISLHVSVATEYGETRIEPADNINIVHGRKNAEEIGKLIEESAAELVIDATHPYATEVTQILRRVCEEKGLEYIRLLRGNSTSCGASCVYVADSKEAAEYLNSTSGNILLTTGSKDLEHYTAVSDFKSRIYARILPMPETIERARELGYDFSHIIGMQGPFNEELNAAMFKMLDIRYMVSKDTGSEGGFSEKIAAAESCGVISVIITRPPDEEGLSCEECLELLGRRYGIAQSKDITIIGIGMGSEGCLTKDAEKACKEADLIIGAKRVTEALAGFNRPFETAVLPEDIERIIRESSFTKIVVAMSGDTGFYSGTKKLLPLIKDLKPKVLPGISSIQYFCSRIGESWDNALLISLHGRYCNFLAKIKKNPRVFALAGGEPKLSDVIYALNENGLSDVEITVGENLSYDNERIVRGRARELAGTEFGSLALVYIYNRNAENALVTHGLDDSVFLRTEIPMTKQEVRSLTLSKLELKKNSICWDVGAGTGSVSLEMAACCEDGFVYAVEKNDAACDLIKKNMKHLGISNVKVVKGEAPEALEALPAPSAVFIGGSSGRLKSVIQAALGKNPDVRIVINAVTVETLSDASSAVKELGLKDMDIVQLSAARGRKLGDYHLMTAINPVFIISCRGGGSNE